MIIRFFVNNVFSFGEEKEFNTFPSPKGKRLKEHKYHKNGFDILKLSAIYGANAAGKSNIVRALKMLQEIVINEVIAQGQTNTQFKFREEAEMPQILGIEFFQSGKAYYYAIKIIGNKIDTEELYESGLGKKKDSLIFERKTIENERTSIRFFDKFNKEKENVVLKNVIEKNLSKPNKPILKLLAALDNDDLKEIKDVLNWFENTLQIITPYSKSTFLSHIIDTDSVFHKYAQDTLCAFHVGINSLKSEKTKWEEFRGKNDILREVVQNFQSSSYEMRSLSYKGSEFLFVKERDGIYVKQLQLEHSGKNGKNVYFNIEEESDGTRRLLDFIPVLKDIFSRGKVYVIDEIERSIHPMLIKEIIRKFSADKETTGQLIFTTHESNLLNQNIFRQDEIWFAEKDLNGSTDLYSLSDFKEHSTIDIQKGYLIGRYGSIPFLSNLQDLNWHSYDPVFIDR
jgi:AAA15 family ATPase/GTPase